MRLTVGPLPAAVYWRRRAVVLVALAMVILIVTYSCSGSSPSGADTAGQGGNPGAGASPTGALLHPTIGKSPGGGTGTTPSPTASPTPTPFTLQQPPSTGPCTDTEISLTATASRPDVRMGESVPFTIAIKNMSSRACARDIGADMQELVLLDAPGTSTVWSSDDCNPNSGHDVRQFAPGQQYTFTLTWAGKRSRSGTGKPPWTCGSAGTPLDPGEYQLVARLDKEKSSPYRLNVTA